MTHEKALKILRELGSPIGEYGLMTKSDADDIADRLERYHALLDKCWCRVPRGEFKAQLEEAMK